MGYISFSKISSSLSNFKVNFLRYKSSKVTSLD